jgi:hypothetical protein
MSSSTGYIQFSSEKLCAGKDEMKLNQRQLDSHLLFRR